MDHQQQPIIQIELPQAVQDQIANLEQQVLLLQQHVGQPQPPPVHGPQLAPAPRFRLNFATYNAKGPNAEIDYDSFEISTQHWSTRTNGHQHSRSKPMCSMPW